jgi:hypothetical protein
MSLIIKAEAVVPKEKRVKTTVSTSRFNSVEYHWISLDNGYVVLLPDGNHCKLLPVDGEWQFEAVFSGAETLGRRKTLAEAFRAVDNIIYRTRHDLWSKCRCRVVIEKISALDGIEDQFGDLP